MIARKEKSFGLLWTMRSFHCCVHVCCRCLFVLFGICYIIYGMKNCTLSRKLLFSVSRFSWYLRIRGKHNELEADELEENQGRIKGDGRIDSNYSNRPTTIVGRNCGLHPHLWTFVLFMLYQSQNSSPSFDPIEVGKKGNL